MNLRTRPAAMRDRLRQIVCLLLLAGLTVSTQGGLVARLLFELRRDYIARQLCENRFVPESPCGGQCFLKKRLAESEHRQESQPAAFAPSPVGFYLPGEAAAMPACPSTARTYAEAAPPRQGRVPPRPLDPPPRPV